MLKRFTCVLKVSFGLTKIGVAVFLLLTTFFKVVVFAFKTLSLAFVEDFKA